MTEGGREGRREREGKGGREGEREGRMKSERVNTHNITS